MLMRAGVTGGIIHYFIRPVAHGLGNGRNWANAASLSSLPDFFAHAKPGAMIYIRADEGSYAIDSSLNTLLLSGGGMYGHPVTVTGVDVNLAPMNATFTSTRNPPKYFTLTGTTTSASPTITGIADTSDLLTGMSVSGDGIPNGTTVIAIPDGTSVTLSANATASATVSISYSVFLYRTDFETSGYDVFALADGIRHATIQNFAFQDVGCVFVPQGDASNLAITDMSVDNSFSFFSNETDNLGRPVTADQFHMEKLTFQRITSLGYSLGCIRIAQTYHRLLIEDVEGDSQNQRDVAFCINFHISGTTQVSTDSDWLADNPGGGAIYRRCTAKNAYYHSSATDLDGVYWNSDGFCDERTVTGSLYEDCVSSGNTDGGWDCKSTNLHLVRCQSSDNKIDYKIWGSAVLDECESTDPYKRGGTGAPAHLSFFGGSDIVCTLNDFTATGSVGNSAVFLTSQSSAIGANTLNVDGYDIHLQPGTTLLGSLTAPGTLTTNFNPALPTLNLAINWRPGYGPTRVASGTPSGTVLADLAVTGTGASGAALAMTADLHSAFAIVGTTLTLASTLDANTFAYHSFTVQATDSTGAVNTAASGAFYVDTPTPNFSCDWNGTNGATTAVDDGAGATITFTSCALTTTSPIEGSASLLLTGGNQRCTVPDNDTWAFDGMFSVKAKINLTSLSALAVILAHWNTSSNQRAWQLSVSTAGAAQLIYSTPSSPGNGTTTITSANGLIVTGQTYEIAADRDANSVIRLYIDGVMVASAAGPSNGFKNSTAGLTIGNTANGTVALAGQIDKTRVWKGWPFCASDGGYTVT